MSAVVFERVSGAELSAADRPGAELTAAEPTAARRERVVVFPAR